MGEEKEDVRGREVRGGDCRKEQIISSSSNKGCGTLTYLTLTTSFLNRDMKDPSFSIAPERRATVSPSGH